MVANWKMNKTRDDALAFIYAINENLPSCDKVDTVICAPSILLRDLVKRQGDNLKIGAQNMYYAEFGAFTGEVSPVMLQTTGVEYVIVGHSERRSLFGETDDMINKKVKAAVEHNLIPILCVGETLEQRELGITSSVIRKQLENALEGIPSKDINNVVIAYEPIWAIGTGKTASSNDAEVESIGYNKTDEETNDVIIDIGYDKNGDDSAITEHVKNIRAKFRKLELSPVETVWGIGYRWKE